MRGLLGCLPADVSGAARRGRPSAERGPDLPAPQRLRRAVVAQQEGGGLALRRAQQGAEGGQLQGEDGPQSARGTRVGGWGGSRGPRLGIRGRPLRRQRVQGKGTPALGARSRPRLCPWLCHGQRVTSSPQSSVSSAGRGSGGLAPLGRGLPALGTTPNTYKHPNTAGPRCSREPGRLHGISTLPSIVFL